MSNQPSRTVVPNQLITEGGYGVVPPDLYASINNFVRIVLAVDTLIRREGIQFFAYDLLHAVVCPKWEPGTHLSMSNHYIWLKNNQQPQARLVTESLDKDLYSDKLVGSRAIRSFELGMTGCGHSLDT